MKFSSLLLFVNLAAVLPKELYLYSILYCPGPGFSLFRITLGLVEVENLATKTFYFNKFSSGL